MDSELARQADKVGINRELVVDLALRAGFSLSTGHGQGIDKLMPITDTETLMQFAIDLARIVQATPPEGGDTEAGEPEDARRYRWLNRQHNFLMYIEGPDETRTNVRLRCGLPLDEWIDNRIAEDAQRAPQEER